MKENLLKLKNDISNNVLQYAVLLVLVVLYIYNISHHFWSLPAPSDPLQYLGSAVWKTTWGYWPWLDRISLAVNLRLFTILFSKGYIAGMVYIGFINTAILITSMFWAFKKSGFWAALIVGTFINSSYLMLGWGTYLYPDQTVALYSLITFMFFFSKIKESRYIKPILIAGIFAALTLFTKATGIAVPIFFIGYIIFKKNWKHLKQFVLGMIAGSALIILLFILLYNWQSFVNVYQHFFFGKLGISNNLITDLTHSGVAYYHKIILSMKYFPFIALLIILGAYKNKKTKNLLFLAWMYIIIVSIVRPAAPSIPSYIYSAYIFICLGLSIYLADLMNIHKTTKSIYNKKYIPFVFCGLALLLIMLGLKLGFKYSPVQEFNYGYNYLIPSDIYTHPTNLVYPTIIKSIYVFGPLIILGLLIYCLNLKSKKLILLFILTVAFWSSFSNGGLAYKKTLFDKNHADFFYKAAPILNLVSAKKFSIYIEEWNKHSHAERILWVYRIFFNKKYQRVFEPKHKSQYENEYEIKRNIAFIKNEQDIQSEIQGTQILTDNEKVILRYFPWAKKIVEIPYEKKMLVVLDISQDANNMIKIDEYKHNFSDWDGPKKIPMEKLTETSPPLVLMGNRGKFSFEQIEQKNDNIIRVKLIEPHPTENPIVLFGFHYQIENPEKIFVTLTANTRPSIKNSASLFIQDKTKDWGKNSKPMSSKTWEEHSVNKQIRDNATDLIVGIDYQPKSKDEWLDIKNIRIILWQQSVQKEQP